MKQRFDPGGPVRGSVPYVLEPGEGLFNRSYTRQETSPNSQVAPTSARSWSNNAPAAVPTHVPAPAAPATGRVLYPPPVGSPQPLTDPNPWFDKPKPRRKITDLVAVRFVGITALAAVIGLPIWWTGWHLLDRYLGWIWT